MEQTPENIEGRALVEKMTNKQRSVWARAGYLGLRNSNYEPEKIKSYVPGEVYIVTKGE